MNYGVSGVHKKYLHYESILEINKIKMPNKTDKQNTLNTIILCQTVSWIRHFTIGHGPYGVLFLFLYNPLLCILININSTFLKLINNLIFIKYLLFN